MGRKTEKIKNKDVKTRSLKQKNENLKLDIIDLFEERNKIIIDLKTCIELLEEASIFDRSGHINEFTNKLKKRYKF